MRRWPQINIQKHRVIGEEESGCSFKYNPIFLTQGNSFFSPPQELTEAFHQSTAISPVTAKITTGMKNGLLCFFSLSLTRCYQSIILHSLGNPLNTVFQAARNKELELALEIETLFYHRYRIKLEEGKENKQDLNFTSKQAK